MKANDEFESDDISYRYNSDNDDALPEMRPAGNLILNDEPEAEPEPKKVEKVVKVKMISKVKTNVASALKNKIKEKTQPD